MTEKQNQQPQVSLETSSEQALLEQPAANAEELSINVNSETLSQLIENSGKDRLKALGRLMMVSVSWTLAGLSQRK